LRFGPLQPSQDRLNLTPSKNQGEQSDAKKGEDGFCWFLANLLFDFFLDRLDTFLGVAPRLLRLTSILVRCGTSGGFKIVGRCRDILGCDAQLISTSASVVG
jgi:hypothetical protein